MTTCPFAAHLSSMHPGIKSSNSHWKYGLTEANPDQKNPIRAWIQVQHTMPVKISGQGRTRYHTAIDKQEL